MITLQHSLVTLFGLRGEVEEFEGDIPYVLIPDAIRRYCGPRPYSHFEETPDGKDISYMQFPRNLKTLTKESMGNERMHLAEGYKPCVLGEKTHVEAFERTNADLPPLYYAGVKKHLVQDVIFDEFVREGMGLDCSRRFESMHSPEETTPKNVGIYTFKRPIRGEDGKITYQEETLDGEGVRKLIADVESHGFYILAYMVHRAFGITANQEWFDEHVKKPLDAVYSKDLADGTYQFMKIPEEINKRITEHDWTHLEEGILPLEVYEKMYSEVIKRMPNIDVDKYARRTAYERNQRTRAED